MRAWRRFWRALGFKWAGQVDEAADAIATAPHAIRANFAEMVDRKVQEIDQLTTAHGNRIAQQEQKLAQIKELTEGKKGTESLEKWKAGALAKAKHRVAELQKAGKSPAEIQQDADYIRCSAAFRDFSSTLEEKEARIADLEAGIANDDESIKRHRLNIEQADRDLAKLKEEAEDTVSDIIAAKQEQAQAALEAGISSNDMSQDLQRMRKLRAQAKGKARSLRELAGTDQRVVAAEFMEWAEASAASDEFAQLTGLAAKADTTPAVAATPVAPVTDAPKGGGLPG